MQSRLLFLLAILVLTLASTPTLAQPRDDGFVVWDQSIASAVSAGLADDSRCGSSPYALYGPRCHRQLNLGFDRPIMFLTFLDKAALFLYEYHKLDYNQSIWDNTKLKFELNLKNVYKQQAEARIELRYRFSTAWPSFDLFGPYDGLDLSGPSFYQN